MGDKLDNSRSTLYFEQCGSVNLANVIRCIRRAFRHRESLRTLKLIFFTAYGEGPVLATKLLSRYQPKIIAVTFPPSFRVRRDEETIRVEVPQEVARYLRALDVDILSTRLPFDSIDGTPMYSSQLELVSKALSLTCSSLPLCVQAVLQACDFGLVEEGEDVIGITGDCAAIITASSTKTLLSPRSSFFIKEFLCKPSVKEWPTSRTRASARISKQPRNKRNTTILEGKP